MSNQSPRRLASRGRILGGLALGLFLPFSTNGLYAQPADAPGAEIQTVTPATAGPLTLDDCLRIAFEQQPALAAHRASLAAAQTQYAGLEKLHAPPLLARDLPIRRRQACLGIRIAQAGLSKSEVDAVYAVERTYFSVIYARQQDKVAGNVVDSLKFYQQRVKEIVQKGESREWTTSTVDKITVYLRLAETRQADAARGIGRALAALREAMGLPPETPIDVADSVLPTPSVTADKEQIVALALARRGEMVQAETAARVVNLEIRAQEKSFLPQFRTFASVVDIHAVPVPQGVANDEYRPGATSLEMPVQLAGPRSYRVERAEDFSARAAAVVDKTRNLIALEAEDAYYKWLDATHKLPVTKDAAEAGERLSKNTRQDFSAGQRVRIEDILMNEVLSGQAQAAYNEALYLQIVGLAGLQRVTAGAFDPGLATPPVVHP